MEGDPTPHPSLLKRQCIFENPWEIIVSIFIIIIFPQGNIIMTSDEQSLKNTLVKSHNHQRYPNL